MIINFLQTRQPPILPALQARPHREYRADDGSEAGYDDQIQHLEGFGNANLESLGMLVFQFFRYYSFQFDYEKYVVCVRKGKPIPRTEKNWGPGTPGGLWSLCIEEPFNQTRNLGNSCDATAFRGIHIEMRSAFIALCKASLDRVMEAYEFHDAKDDKAPLRIAPFSMPAPTTRMGPPPAPRPVTVTSDPATSNRGHRSMGRRARINDTGINGAGVRAVPTGPSNRRPPNGPTVAQNGQYPASQLQFAPNGEYHSTDFSRTPTQAPWEAMSRWSSMACSWIIAHVTQCKHSQLRRFTMSTSCPDRL
jgi:Cid1 family poly A polymerase